MCSWHVSQWELSVSAWTLESGALYTQPVCASAVSMGWLTPFTQPPPNERVFVSSFRRSLICQGSPSSLHSRDLFPLLGEAVRLGEHLGQWGVHRGTCPRDSFWVGGVCSSGKSSWAAARLPPHLIREGSPWAAGTAVGGLGRALRIDCAQDQC